MLPILLSYFMTPSAVSAASLSLGGNRCGTITCEENQYCSKIDTHCYDCSSICDESSHNYEEKVCVEQCQSKFHPPLISFRHFHYQLWQSVF